MAKRTLYSAIGLDIASARIKLLQLKWQKGFLSIHAASQIGLTNGQDEKELVDALRRLLSGGKFKGNRVIAALPNHLVTTIPIKFALKEGEGMDQAILREAHNYLSFPLEGGAAALSHFVIDYLSLPSSDQRSQTKAQPLAALLIAARREDIMRYLRLLKTAGLGAAVIEPRYCSLFRTIQWARKGDPLPGREKNAPHPALSLPQGLPAQGRGEEVMDHVKNPGHSLKDQFIFSLEENDTLFMVLVDEQILVVRELAWGINAIKERVEKALGLSGKRVDRVLQHYGVDLKRLEDPVREMSNLSPQPGTNERIVEAASSRLNKCQHNDGKGDDFLSETDPDPLWRSRCQVIYEVLSPVLEDFCQEIQKVLSYCVSMVQQRVIDRALLLGEGTVIRSLDHFIQQRTGIQITTWPSAIIEGSAMVEDNVSIIKELAEDHPFFEVSLGLALRGTKSGTGEW